MEFLTDVQNIQTASSCWFGLVRDYCFYDTLQPPVLFSLGDAVAAFGLIFAAYQLKSKAWALVLRIRPWWQRYSVWILAGLGFFMISLAALLSQISIFALPPPFNYRLFYEILGSFFFICAPLSVVILGSGKRNLFNIKNAQDFYELLVMESARADKETLEVCLNIIGANLQEILTLLSARRPRYRGDLPAKTTKEISAEYAAAILDVVVGDKQMTKYIATQRLDFLFHLFTSLSESGVNERISHMGIQALIEELFNNPDSYLHKQQEFSGLGLSIDLYSIIFKDAYLLNNFSFFQDALPFYRTDVTENPKRLEVVLRALKEASSTYYETNSGFDSDTIKQGIRELGQYATSLALRVSIARKTKNQDFYLISKIAKDQFSTIASFLGRDFPRIYKENFEHMTKKEQLAPPGSVVHEYASTLFEFYSALAMIETDDSSLQNECPDLYFLGHQVLESFIYENGVFDAARNVFLTKMWGQIEENVSSGIYPEVLRPYLRNIGFYATTPPGTGWLGVETTKMVELLYNKLRPKILTNHRMVNNVPMRRALLPQEVVFNDTNGQFERVMSDGRHILIPPPP